MVTSLSYLLFYSIAYQHFDYSDSNHQIFCLHSWIFATCVSTHSNFLPPKQPTKNEKKKRPSTRVLWLVIALMKSNKLIVPSSMFCPSLNIKSWELLLSIWLHFSNLKLHFQLQFNLNMKSWCRLNFVRGA